MYGQCHPVKAIQQRHKIDSIIKRRPSLLESRLFHVNMMHLRLLLVSNF